MDAELAEHLQREEQLHADAHLRELALSAVHTAHAERYINAAIAQALADAIQPEVPFLNLNQYHHIVFSSPNGTRHRFSTHAPVAPQPPDDGDESDYEFYTRLAESIGNVVVRVPSRVLRALPTRRASEEDASLKCMVCLCHAKPDENLKVLPCRHEFHVGCVDEWLRQSKKCPICREEVCTSGT